MLVIFDKDGTLTTPASGATFVQSPTDQILLSGVVDRLAELEAMGATIAIASNQAGVAAGHKTLVSAANEMAYCMNLIGIKYLAYFCPDFEGKECYHVAIEPHGYSAHAIHNNANAQHLVGSFRKPQAGMLQFVMQWGGFKDVVFVGDRPEDREAAQSAGVAFVDAEAWRTGVVKIQSGMVAPA